MTSSRLHVFYHHTPKNHDIYLKFGILIVTCISESYVFRFRVTFKDGEKVNDIFLRKIDILNCLVQLRKI